jgi:hypothetical protein
MQAHTLGVFAKVCDAHRPQTVTSFTPHIDPARRLYSLTLPFVARVLSLSSTQRLCRCDIGGSDHLQNSSRINRPGLGDSDPGQAGSTAGRLRPQNASSGIGPSSSIGWAECGAGEWGAPPLTERLAAAAAGAAAALRSAPPVAMMAAGALHDTMPRAVVVQRGGGGSGGGQTSGGEGRVQVSDVTLVTQTSRTR